MIKELLQGLKLTIKHFKNFPKRRKPVSIMDDNYFSEIQDKLITLRYPAEKIKVPDVGRYKLELELDDCIGCDLCARICPVNCITIDKVRTKDDLGKTRNGKPKRFYFKNFEIDLAQCCYCGLCTTVCPTDCLIMTPEYDYSTKNRNDLLLKYSNYQ